MQHNIIASAKLPSLFCFNKGFPFQNSRNIELPLTQIHLVVLPRASHGHSVGPTPAKREKGSILGVK